MQISGIPITKYQCFVLCLNTYIPIHVPILPPSRLHKNNVFSEIRHAFRFAFALSAPIIRKPAIFTNITYKYTNCIFIPQLTASESIFKRSKKAKVHQAPCLTDLSSLCIYVKLHKIFKLLLFLQNEPLIHTKALLLYKQKNKNHIPGQPLTEVQNHE